MKSTARSYDASQIWDWVLLSLCAGTVALRLTIWKLFRREEVFFREDFSNLAVAFFILLIVILWAGRKLVRREPLRASGLEWPVLLWTGGAAVSVLYSAEPYLSLVGVLVLLSQALFFYVLLDLLNTPFRIRAALFFMLALAALTSAFGIKEFFYLWNRPGSASDETLAQVNRSLHYVLITRRVTSFLGWPNSLAGFLGLLIPVSGVFCLYFKRPVVRVFFGIVSFVLLACFLFTFSFLGWLSFLLASLCFVPFLLRQVKFPSWSWWKKGLVIALAVTFAGLFLWVIARKNFWGAFYPRYLYYRAAWELLVARPFGGHGWGTFGILERAFNSQITGLTAFVHNSYLQAWVEGGFLCFSGFVSLALLFVRRIRRLFASFTGAGGEFLALAIGWGLAAFFIDNLFSFTFIKPNIALYGWVMLAVFFAFDHKPGTSLREKKGLPFGSLGILVLCGLMGVVFVRLLGGFFFYHGAKYGPDARIYSKAMQGFSRAGRWDVWSPNIPKAAGDLATRAFDMTKDPAYLRQAELQYLEALRRSPYSYAPCFLLGRVYQMLGQNEKSFAFALRARELSPAEFERDIQRLRSYEEERHKREEAFSPN